VFGSKVLAVVWKEVVMDSSSPHILVVAASPALRFTLEELLLYYGYTVSTAATAEAAALVAYGPFDVVVLDKALPAIPESDGTPLVHAPPQSVLRHALDAEWIRAPHISKQTGDPLL
jgi:CheY-like chemotaxis protein